MFAAQVIERILESLPSPLAKCRRELLPRVLRYWSHVALPVYLDQPTIVQKRTRKLVDDVAKRASQLSIALDKTDEYVIAAMMTQDRKSGEPRIDLADILGRLREAREVVTELAAMSPQRGTKAGRPRNVPAYFVLQDAAAIFEWYTGRRATRVVSRDSGKDSGAFFDFASVLWPVVFDDGVAGLTAAMKNWAIGRSRHGERSPLMVNMDMRHPEWGLLER